MVAKTESIVMTPEMARHMRETMHFERQRKLSDDNILRLATAMVDGDFIQGTQVFLCVLPTGRTFIVNGNHTLEAIVLCDLPQRLEVTYLPVPDLEEVARVYATFDTHKPRTWTDSLKALGKYETLTGASRFMSAVNCIANNFDQFGSPGAPSRLARMDLLDDYIPAIAEFKRVTHGVDKEVKGNIYRAAVLAVALETCRYQPEKAAKFWDRVTHGWARTGDPEYALLRWLRNAPSAAGIGHRAEHAKAASLAWNAAFQGRELTYVKPKASGKFTLLGTPWAKGVHREKSQLSDRLTKMRSKQRATDVSNNAGATAQ